MHWTRFLPLAAAVVFATPAPSHEGVPKINFQGKEMENFLVFGDSYTFVQGTEGHWAYSFISDAFNYSFTPQELLTDEIVLNQTSSGGPNWVEYLTGCFEGLPKNCPATKLWDFAFAGADISSEYLPLHHNFTVPFVDQVTQWDLYARNVTHLNPSETLVGFWIGINDINDSDDYNVTFSDFYNELMDAYFESVELIYSRGYRNFLFMLLPPLDKTPGNVNSASPSPSVEQLSLFDETITAHIADFKAAHPHSGLKTYAFDTYTYLDEILANPSEYGFVNTTSYCADYAQPDILWNYEAYGCLPIWEYFWFNTGHITYPVHKLIAGELRKSLSFQA